MATRPQLCLLSSLVLLLTSSCYREHTADEEPLGAESDDAGTDVVGDGGNAAAPDAGCNGQDAISQLVCQLGAQGARADAGAGQQQSLQDLLNGLAGLTGVRDAGAGAIDLQGLLGGILGAAGGLGGSGGAGSQGGLSGLGGMRRDAGRPAASSTPDTPSWGGFGRRDGGTLPTPPPADAGSPPDSADASSPSANENDTADAGADDDASAASADATVAAP